MKFTGERFIPTEQGQIRLEHYHRYAVVLDFVKGKTVLDIGCGEGYGSFLMANEAHSVIGVDISYEAVRYALKTYDKKNLRFVQGSATKLAFQDNLFDAIISFETIEHLSEQKQMVSEIRRVLRPDGVLIISSPNRPVYSEESREQNEFHVKELDFNEFDALLRSQFPKVEYFGQRMQMSSVIQPVNGAPGISSVWSDDGRTLSANAGRLSEPVYFLALCGSANADLPKIGMSALYPESTDLVKHYVGFAKWAKSLDKIISERDAQILNLDKIISERDAQILNLDKIIFAFLKSKSWRITRPLREIRRWLSAPKEQAVRALKAVVAVLKRNHHHLPISYKVKVDIYRILCMRFPGISGLYAAKPPIINLNHLSKFIIDGPLNSQSLEKMLDAILPIRMDEAPLVSVIIPVYGKINFTLSCLYSISKNLPLAAFEVIVVDDCSPDNSEDILSKVKGIRVQRNENNQGFIRSCNIGAKAAKGQYLYFLNNDTVVTTGWLDELLRTFLEFPGTGLVGSKLIYPDGRLQEAGGIIWQDGSAWNFGRFQDQQLPVYNYAREVDYCSGASIMVPKSLFEELGGFDECYLPAYCEDADLALKIRYKGYRVIYQPLSAVIHYEGITSGTDTTQGTKAYQVENNKKLFERWQKRLATHQEPGSEVDNAKDRRATRRVLVLDHCTPTPNQDAGSVTAFNLMLLLREMDFQVTFIPESNFLFMHEYTTALQRNGIEVLYAPYLTSVVKHLKEQGARYDLILLIRPIVVKKYIEKLRKFCPKAKVLFETADLHYLRMQREAELYKDPKIMQNAIAMKEVELKAIKSVDATILRSESEYEILRPILQKEKMYVFPLILDVSGTAIGFLKRNDIVFVGGYSHTPNIDAVKYFVKDIMPLLRKQLPGVRFYAVGSNPPTETRDLESDDVIITGFVEHLNPFLDKMRVSIAPLRYGAGIKGKIGTAMAVGLPVVATSIAAEGMSLKNGENILVADGPEAFANAISKIYLNEGLWNSISQNGLAFAVKTWGAQAAWEILAGILRELDLNPTRNNRELTLYNSNFQERLRTKFERLL